MSPKPMPGPAGPPGVILEATDDRLEARYIALGLVVRLREGSIPPDDAYAWTRILWHAFEIDRPHEDEAPTLCPQP